MGDCSTLRSSCSASRISSTLSPVSMAITPSRALTKVWFDSPLPTKLHTPSHGDSNCRLITSLCRTASRCTRCPPGKTTVFFESWSKLRATIGDATSLTNFRRNRRVAFGRPVARPGVSLGSSRPGVGPARRSAVIPASPAWPSPLHREARWVARSCSRSTGAASARRPPR